MDTREHFLIKMSGGPHPGSRTCRDGDSYGGFIFTWPLPDVLGDAGGTYVKAHESKLPPQAHDSYVVRGAQYEWKPDGS